MTRNTFAIHVHAMPSIEMNGFVVTMPDAASREYLGVANHAAPVHSTGIRIIFQKLVVFKLRDPARIGGGHHDSDSEAPYHLFAQMRLASAATAERFVPQDCGVLCLHARLTNKEPLSLPDRLAAFDLRGSKTRDRGSYIVDT